MKVFTTLILFVFCLSQNITKASIKLDSIFIELNSISNDSIKLNDMHQLVSELKLSHPEVCSIVIDSAILLAKKANKPKIINSLLYYKSFILESNSDYWAAIDMLESQLNLVENINLKERYYTKIARLYYFVHDYENELRNELLAFDILKENLDTINKVVARSNIANLYIEQKKYDKAKNVYVEGIVLCNELLKKTERSDYNYILFVKSSIYNKLGAVFSNKNQEEKAIPNYFIALSQLNKLVSYKDDRNWKYYRIEQLKSYELLGYSFLSLENAKKSLIYLDSALLIASHFSYNDELSYIYKLIGEYHVLTNNYDSAYIYYNLGLNIVSNSDNLSALRDLYLALSDISTRQSDYEKALEHRKNYELIKDSISAQSTSYKTLNLMSKYEFKEQKQQIDLQNEKLKTQEAEIKSRNIMLGAGSSIVLLLLAIGIVYNKRKQVENEIQNLNEKHNAIEHLRDKISKELHDGIGYKMREIRTQLENAELAEKEDILSKIKATTTDIKSLSYRLKPTDIENISLREAIEIHVTNLNHISSIFFDLKIFPENLLDKLSKPFQHHLHRILQECTSNVIDHSKAQKVEINIVEIDKQINLMFEDDGVGFKKELIIEGSGLINIKKRCEDMNAKLHIDSKLGRGTIFSIYFDKDA